MIVPLNTVHTPYESDGVWAIADKKSEAIKDLIGEGRESVSVKKDPKHSVKGLN